MSAVAQTFEFQAETAELLRLMIHSLYTNRDVFLRELISNASDALDRLRFEAIVKPGILEGDDRYEIRIDADPNARTLTIRDTGIGMSRSEVAANIGTIAKSGTRELRRRLQEEPAPGAAAEFIGQFGVGFYSAFIVADRVTLTSRRAGELEATEWASTGDGTYTMEYAQKAERGTTIVLHLRPASVDEGMDDYTDRWRIQMLVRRYSDFIGYPIILAGEGLGAESAEANKEPGSKLDADDRVLNSMKPVWKRLPAEITGKEYLDFYNHLSHDSTDPLKTIHFKAEGSFEYDALLYIPATAPHDLYYATPDVGLRLYSSRVLITDKCPDLLPRYLRFIQGVVDVSDLPLNISRQRLQQDHHATVIRTKLTRKVLEALKDLFQTDRAKYVEFWRAFGRAVKEGISSDFQNKERMLPLLLFQSSHHPEQLTTLSEYVGRMKSDQAQILYLTGESRRMLENCPHLEAIAGKGYEVLFMVDPVDELVVEHLREYEGKKLKSAGKGDISLEPETGGAGPSAEEKRGQQEDFRGLMDYLQTRLDEHVKNIRLSNRLTSSPACLVVEEHDYSPMLERVLMKGKGGGPKQRRVLELNPQHQLILHMRQRQSSGEADPALERAADAVFGLALLSEGSELPDPVRFSRAVIELIKDVV